MDPIWDRKFKQADFHRRNRNQGAEKSNRTGFFIVEWNSILKSSGEKTIPKVQN